MNIDISKYTNPIEVKNRLLYDKYIVTAVENNLNDVLGSCVMTMDFKGEDVVSDMLKNTMNKHYKLLFKEIGEVKEVEHTESTILTALETEFTGNDCEYHKELTIPLTDFRIRFKDTKKMFYRMPKFVNIHFNIIDGTEEYNKSVKKHEEHEIALLEKFIVDIVDIMKIKRDLFDFIMKGENRKNRTRFMTASIKNVDEYLSLTS